MVNRRNFTDNLTTNLIVSVMLNDDAINRWTTPDHAWQYLNRADHIPHRREGEQVLLDHIPLNVGRVLDLGTGDGRLLGLLKGDRPPMESIALDFSPTMLAQASDRFREDPTVTVVAHNLDQPLPDLGNFEAIVSSFAIHHLSHERKRSLYGEIFARLQPGGIFANLEQVASPSPALHRHFMESIGYGDQPDDPSNQLLDLHTQLTWLTDIGFEDVDCYWKWLEMALMIGVKPLDNGQKIQ
ncbi:class I SAM-dependent methyltransferase [Spirulina sp. CCNP1310]|nr:class I SAM-dependent methyltransferase [Spirulina sp. CCNP1310]MEA5419234.1 class I SAM-dependent methyltransferase [Spirulina sp. CCNP1310]